jgi:BASS family bile acid:Na+ symporter
MRDTLLHVLKVALGIAIPLASFTTGVRAASIDPLWLFRRGSLLARSLLAIFVFVPLATVFFLTVVKAPQAVTAGLIVSILAVGIGPPAAMKRTSATDANVAYEVELNIVVQVLAIIFVPLAIAALGSLYHFAPRLESKRVAFIVLERVVVPVVIGVLAARFVPRLAKPLARIAAPLIQLLLLAVIVLALVFMWKSLLGIGGQAWLLAAAVALLALAIGHLTGGADPGERSVLASFSVMRFPALALLIASILPRGRQLLPIVLAYTLCALVFTGIYGAVTKRRRAARGTVHRDAHATA